MGTGGPFPGSKVRPGSDADRSPPSSVEVKNEQELFLLFASSGADFLQLYRMKEGRIPNNTHKRS
jgi:hypothetical protein